MKNEEIKEEIKEMFDDAQKLFDDAKNVQETNDARGAFQDAFRALEEYKANKDG